MAVAGLVPEIGPLLLSVQYGVLIMILTFSSVQPGLLIALSLIINT